MHVGMLKCFPSISFYFLSPCALTTLMQNDLLFFSPLWLFWLFCYCLNSSCCYDLKKRDGRTTKITIREKKKVKSHKSTNSRQENLKMWLTGWNTGSRKIRHPMHCHFFLRLPSSPIFSGVDWCFCIWFILSCLVFFSFILGRGEIPLFSLFFFILTSHSLFFLLAIYLYMYVLSLSYLDFELDLISEVISRLVLDVLIYFSLPLVYIHIASIFIYIFGNYILLLY